MQLALKNAAHVVMGVCLAGSVAAATSAANPSERYPWDQRPGSCETAPQSSPACNAVDWPSFMVARTRLRQLLYSARFDLLESALSELATSDDIFADFTTKTDVVSYTLADLVPANATSTDRNELLEKWRQAVPGSPFVSLIDAMLLYRDAIGGLNSTLPSARELSQEMLVQAEKQLLALPNSIRGTAIWHLAIFQVTADMDAPQSNRAKLYAVAVQRWPRHLPFYKNLLSDLRPGEGADWAAIEDFIDAASRRTAATDGASFYARLYSDLGDWVVTGRTGMRWAHMNQGFIDWIARYPNRRSKNLYASFACLAGDKPAFKSAMRMMKTDEIAREAWLSGHGYDACARWAAR